MIRATYLIGMNMDKQSRWVRPKEVKRADELNSFSQPRRLNFWLSAFFLFMVASALRRRQTLQNLLPSSKIEPGKVQRWFDA
jgi:hypothetical protein